MEVSSLPPVPTWNEASRAISDILYAKADEGIAKIAINRPEVRNAFRPETVREMQAAFADARDDAGHRRRDPHRPGQGGVLLGRRPARARRRAATSAATACRA